MTMKSYVSVNPLSLADLKAESGWKDGPDGDSLTDGHGNQVFLVEEPDGHITIEFDDELTDASDLLDRVSFERVAE
jgi:hypothetical protein